MRYSILLFAALLTLGCSTSKPHQEKGEVITRVGVIIDKYEIDLNQVEQGSNTQTSVYGSVSSDGGVAIGLGILLGSFSSGGTDDNPVRYGVELTDGSRITIYQESNDFEVDDCVEITSYPDEEENPPIMKPNKDGCS